MNVILKRRQLILATLVVALGAAVFVNWYYTGDSSLKENNGDSDYVQNLGEAQFVNATETTPSFEEMKFERQKNHDEALDELNKSLEKAGEGSAEAKEITKSIDELTKNHKTQADLESLIKTTVKTECFVTLNEKTATVVVTKSTLNEITSLQILSLVTENTDIEAGNVTMSEMADNK